MIGLESEACGKIILMGEHGAVYGSKAIAMPLDLPMRLTFRVHEGSFAPTSQSPLPSSAEKLSLLWKDLGLPMHEGCSLDIQSEIPMGVGLGSSAALCVASVRLASKMFGHSLSNKALWKKAHELEHHFHGQSSGLDTAVVAYNNFILFQKKEKKPISLKILNFSSLDWLLALIYTGTPASTKIMIEKAYPYFAFQREQKMDFFNSLSLEMIRSLEEDNPTKAGFLMDEAASCLQKAGVVTPAMEILMEQCRSLGALGVKPTGAGGGGCLLALLGKGSSGEQVWERILKSSLGVWQKKVKLP